MLKNDFQLNLTSLVLLVGVVSLFVISVRQCSDKKDLKKSYEHRISEFVILESNIVHSYEKEKKILRDSIEYFRELAVVNKQSANKQRRHIAKLQNELATIEDQVKEIPFDDSYGFLTGLYPPSDTLEYPFAGNQVKELHTDYLEGIKCVEITKELELERKYLVLSMQASGEMNVKQQEEIEACDYAMQELGLKLQEEALQNRELKRKIWTNRSLAGITTIFAILVAL